MTVPRFPETHDRKPDGPDLDERNLVVLQRGPEHMNVEPDDPSGSLVKSEGEVTDSPRCHHGPGRPGTGMPTVPDPLWRLGGNNRTPTPTRRLG
jgi:hypothetical protein